MAIPLTKYVEIKDNYCIGYSGQDEKILLKLVDFRIKLAARLPELNIYIAYNDALSNLMDFVNVSRTIKYSEVGTRLDEFGYFYDLSTQPGRDPVDEFIKECNLEI